MNANELADELENLYNRFLPTHSKFLDILKSATMLRQQQAEIKKIEKLMDFWKESYNELRTNQVKKELTDEEIEECMGCLPKYNNEIVNEDLVKFARAILRKASEK